ncbi:hypothetical protein BU23DRAFT_566977 [Bimuria novae-zelandiae CBS 107.79]|uniref:Uncharacterized protein n=1 Tax=Bimuria novae-zelandiae CBS 107.79 TaxID=1447943 RepID=A0A6A5VCW4_9PLEO|nr:hypothetical protein BU23DRAFT_566977 [Bimuria novae-zelandiae CBS 107.79]
MTFVISSRVARMQGFAFLTLFLLLAAFGCNAEKGHVPANDLNLPICKKLNVIIYGIDAITLKHLGDGTGRDENYSMRTYWVKGQQVTAFDTTPRLAAVKVDLPRLGDRVGDLEILDYDPETTWMGGWPGWHRDD